MESKARLKFRLVNRQIKILFPHATFHQTKILYNSYYLPRGLNASIAWSTATIYMSKTVLLLYFISPNYTITQPTTHPLTFPQNTRHIVSTHVHPQLKATRSMDTNNNYNEKKLQRTLNNIQTGTREKRIPNARLRDE